MQSKSETRVLARFVRVFLLCATLPKLHVFFVGLVSPLLFFPASTPVRGKLVKDFDARPKRPFLPSTPLGHEPMPSLFTYSMRRSQPFSPACGRLPPPPFPAWMFIHTRGSVSRSWCRLPTFPIALCFSSPLAHAFCAPQMNSRSPSPLSLLSFTN